MKGGYFNVKRDMVIVAAGGFFCQACLVGKPASEQSSDSRYCQGCYAFLQAEKKVAELPPKDYWAQDGTFFVHCGKKYGVTKTGATVCLGPVETPPDGSRTAPAGREVVAKIPSKGIIPVDPFQTQGEGIMQQRGRPKKKEGEPVHRATAWRRKKKLEKQGVLFG